VNKLEIPFEVTVVVEGKLTPERKKEIEEGVVKFIKAVFKDKNPKIGSIEWKKVKTASFNPLLITYIIAVNIFAVLLLVSRNLWLSACLFFLSFPLIHSLITPKVVRWFK